MAILVQAGGWTAYGRRPGNNFRFLRQTFVC